VFTSPTEVSSWLYCFEAGQALRNKSRMEGPNAMRRDSESEQTETEVLAELALSGATCSRSHVAGEIVVRRYL
jgi:hypothetical protein